MPSLMQIVNGFLFGVGFWLAQPVVEFIRHLI